MSSPDEKPFEAYKLLIFTCYGGCATGVAASKACIRIWEENPAEVKIGCLPAVIVPWKLKEIMSKSEKRFLIYACGVKCGQKLAEREGLPVESYLEITSALGLRKAKILPSPELEDKVYQFIREEADFLLGHASRSTSPHAPGKELLIAFGTDDGQNLNDDHVGMARYFYVYQFQNGQEKLVEQIENVSFSGDESMKHGDPAKARATSSVLKNVDVLVGKKFGPNINRLLKKFACVIARTEALPQAIEMVKNKFPLIEKEEKKGEERKHIVLKPEEG